MGITAVGGVLGLREELCQPLWPKFTAWQRSKLHCDIKLCFQFPLAPLRTGYVYDNLVDADPEVLREIVLTNTLGPLLSSREAIRLMSKQSSGGRARWILLDKSSNALWTLVSCAKRHHMTL